MWSAELRTATTLLLLVFATGQITCTHQVGTQPCFHQPHQHFMFFATTVWHTYTLPSQLYFLDWPNLFISCLFLLAHRSRKYTLYRCTIAFLNAELYIFTSVLILSRHNVLIAHRHLKLMSLHIPFGHVIWKLFEIVQGEFSMFARGPPAWLLHSQT